MAPALCGLIMNVASLMAGALFIAGWNVVSVVVEYLLLQRVYTLVPRLAYKEGVNGKSMPCLLFWLLTKRYSANFLKPCRLVRDSLPLTLRGNTDHIGGIGYPSVLILLLFLPDWSFLCSFLPGPLGDGVGGCVWPSLLGTWVTLLDWSFLRSFLTGLSSGPSCGALKRGWEGQVRSIV